MNHVKILPKTNRAKNRVKEHGQVMRLVRKGTFEGEPAILAESLGDSWQGEKWMGWLTASEADHIVFSEPHTVSEPSTHDEVMASDNKTIREAYIKSLEKNDA